MISIIDRGDAQCCSRCGTPLYDLAEVYDGISTGKLYCTLCDSHIKKHDSGRE